VRFGCVSKRHIKGFFDVKHLHTSMQPNNIGSIQSVFGDVATKSLDLLVKLWCCFCNWCLITNFAVGLACTCVVHLSDHLGHHCPQRSVVETTCTYFKTPQRAVPFVGGNIHD